VELVLPETGVPGQPTAISVSVEISDPASSPGFFGMFFKYSTPSRHCYRLEVLDPDGMKMPYYAQNLLADKGNASATMTWALNERPGTYSIVVRDVMSGVTAQKTIKIK